jgi:hypothetical protein
MTSRSSFVKRLGPIAWAPPAVFLGHALAAALFGHEPYVDTASHFLGGAAMAHFLDRLPRLAPARLGSPSPFLRRFAVVGGATIVALLWELAELASDLFLGTRIQLSAANTLRDLTLGLAGAICVATLFPERARS